MYRVNNRRGSCTEAVQPLQTEALERSWRTRLLPREEAERYPYADEPGLGHRRPQQANEPLLLRKPETDEYQLGPRLTTACLILSNSAGSSSNPNGGQ